MNVGNQTLMHVKAGHLPPDDMLKLLLDTVKPNAFGFSVQNVENGVPDLAITREDATGMGVDELKKLFVNAKDHDLIVYLAQLAKGYDPQDIQPFVIHDGDNNPFIAIYLEGDIIGNDEPKDHTEQANYVNGILIPQILEWCTDFEGDLEKITPKLKGDVFERSFKMHVGHRAVLTLMPCDGEIIVKGTNTLGYTSDWGWTSQKHGYGDKVIEPEKPAAEVAGKKTFWGGRGQTSVPAVAAPVEPKPDTNDHTKTDKDGKPIHDAATPIGEKKNTQTPTMAARLPVWAKSNDDVKLWYTIVSGEIHPQWKKRLPCNVIDFEAVKINNLIDFKTYALGKALKTTGQKTETSSGSPPPDTGKADVKAISGVMGDKELPIIGPKAMEGVLDFITKYLDGNSNVIPDPKEMQAIEKALPNFEAACGLNNYESLNWPPAALVGIGKTDIMALVTYALTWRSYARPYVLLELEKAKAGSTTTVTKLGDNTTKTESIANTHVLANNELKPAKKAFWGGKQVA